MHSLHIGISFAQEEPQRRFFPQRHDHPSRTPNVAVMTENRRTNATPTFSPPISTVMTVSQEPRPGLVQIPNCDSWDDEMRR